MHLQRTLLALCVFAALACPAAVIYKWTDANGVVHYADQPVPGAIKITIAADVAPPGAAPPAAPPAAPKPPAKPPAVAYSEVKIASPTADQSFFSEPVPVSLRLNPGLQADDTLTWSLNGNALAAYSNQLQFTLQNLPRGAFTLTAAIVSQTSGASVGGASVTFYVHRPSLLMPQHHNLPKPP
ncbi:MAG TPA: DUF4124 domain-containing protein [Steroidobacteraceae bacterium]|nr:DUF4124 domain-containing protein [Steroidobacteraceae bacterium]